MQEVKGTKSTDNESKNNRWVYIELRSLCKTKETNNKLKRQLIELEKIVVNPRVDKGLTLKT